MGWKVQYHSMITTGSTATLGADPRGNISSFSEGGSSRLGGKKEDVLKKKNKFITAKAVITSE